MVRRSWRARSWLLRSPQMDPSKLLRASNDGKVEWNSAARTWRHEKSTPAEGRQTNFKLIKECMWISGAAKARKSYLKCHKYPPNQFYLEVGRLKSDDINSHGKRDKENVFFKEWCGEVFLRETRHQNVYDKSSPRKSSKCISLEVPMRK